MDPTQFCDKFIQEASPDGPSTVSAHSESWRTTLLLLSNLPQSERKQYFEIEDHMQSLLKMLPTISVGGLLTYKSLERTLNHAQIIGQGMKPGSSHDDTIPSTMPNLSRAMRSILQSTKNFLPHIILHARDAVLLGFQVEMR